MKFTESMDLTNSPFYHVTDIPQCQLRIAQQGCASQNHDFYSTPQYQTFSFAIKTLAVE